VHEGHEDHLRPAKKYKEISSRKQSITTSGHHTPTQSKLKADVVHRYPHVFTLKMGQQERVVYAVSAYTDTDFGWPAVIYFRLMLRA